MLTDARTAIIHDGTVGSAIAGISTMEKDGDDPSTSISVWTDGIFEVTASGAVTIGETVKSSSVVNQVEAAANTDLGSKTIGYVLETTSDAEVVNVRIDL